MKNYIYVAAYYAEEKDPQEELISFWHCSIKCGDEEVAYDKGYEKFKTWVKRKEFDFPWGNDILNDYVIEVKK